MSELFSFPNPVNETSARIVAGGVLTMATATVVLDQPWLLAPLTYGFAARVLTGPKLSPLGQLSTRVITQRIKRPAAFSPGPPKRLAQGMGLAMSGTALVLHFGLGRKRAAYAVLGRSHRGRKPGGLRRLLPGLPDVSDSRQARADPGIRLRGLRRHLVTPGAA